jgi:hypothetical protein
MHFDATFFGSSSVSPQPLSSRHLAALGGAVWDDDEAAALYDTDAAADDECCDDDGSGSDAVALAATTRIDAHQRQ